MTNDNETAWLIEHKESHGVLYYGGLCGLKTNEEAIRFSREIDAKRMLNALAENNLLTREKYVVTEHVWMG